jgi:P-type E1-E2 ATPase
VIGATMNTSGSLVIRSEKVGAQTMLAQIVQMVAQAQRSRAPMQRLADVVAGYFVAAVVTVALASFFAWGLFGGDQGWVFGLISAVSVLIIACPCALGLATPMSIMVATGKAATQGILFRDAAAIEDLRRIDTLIVDKTGTLTEGRPRSSGPSPCKATARTRSCGSRPVSTRAVNIRWPMPSCVPRVSGDESRQGRAVRVGERYWRPRHRWRPTPGTR